MTILPQGQAKVILLIPCNSLWPSLEAGLSIRTFCILILGEKPTRCYTMVYWTYNSLNMFRAPLCPSSGARNYRDVHSVWHMALIMAGCWRGVCFWVMQSSNIPHPQRSSILILLAGCLQTCMTCASAEYTVNNSWWWAEEMPETSRVSWQNKFGKLVRLVVFIVKKCAT
jgi:hypothetical protein